MDNYTTTISHIDGQEGKLWILGIPIQEIASQATFEELLYLLWQRNFPSESQVNNLKKELIARRKLEPETLNLLESAAALRIPPMEALRIATATLTFKNQKENSQEKFANALNIVACIPVIVATYWRLLSKKTPLEPHPTLSHTANYLYMLSGNEPQPQFVRALETYFATVVDHGFNASTFSARTIISTRSDLVSAITGAIGAMKGLLHGGAPGPALEMILEIGEPSKAESYIKEKLEQGDRLMGFGHRIYKVKDPRTNVLAKLAKEIYQTKNDTKFLDLAIEIEDTALELLKKYKPTRVIETNVEYYTALLLNALEIPLDIFTPTFTVSRVVGWITHCFEQLEEGRIIRPPSIYNGNNNCHWISNIQQ